MLNYITRCNTFAFPVFLWNDGSFDSFANTFQRYLSRRIECCPGLCVISERSVIRQIFHLGFKIRHKCSESSNWLLLLSTRLFLCWILLKIHIIFREFLIILNPEFETWASWSTRRWHRSTTWVSGVKNKLLCFEFHANLLRGARMWMAEDPVNGPTGARIWFPSPNLESKH